MIVDGTGLVLGRLASIVAKRALNGERTDIINAENVIITGSKKDVLKDYKRKRDLRTRRNPNAGPMYPRSPDAMIKRAVRNMVGYKSAKGKKALKLVKAFNGTPAVFEKSRKVQFQEAKSNPRTRKVSLGEIGRELGYGL